MATDFRPSTQPQPPANSDPSNGQNGAGKLSPEAVGNPSSLENNPLAYGSRLSKSLNTDLTITRKAKLGWVQWFSNLSVGQKQIAGLFTSEVISVLGLVGVGSFLIVSGGRNQLLNQAQAELSVADIEYNIKINQMGFGFRGQSDNVAIVDVARAYAAGQTISQTDLGTVQQILQNEIKARNIEYATLVGNDLSIIANANTNRRGQRFDPDGLVGTVLQNPRQIKTSSLVSWEELQNEGPPLPEGFAEQDALIRYTVTPVSDPNSGTVVGALVSGDIVNGKDQIPRGAIRPFESGYSAVYQRQEDGGFILTTSLNAGDNPDLDAAVANVPWRMMPC
ncbi:MAG: hypothetical protein HC922_10280 [Leptolyngbyaceae cyanobacterium SM2_3_12]|nr:hypothetical protein [Leptolyngbyaceae cyanobacterium SM2_3_12]